MARWSLPVAGKFGRQREQCSRLTPPEGGEIYAVFKCAPLTGTTPVALPSAEGPAADW